MRILPYIIIMVILVVFGCAKKNPPRDEIPLIKGMLGDLQTAIAERDTVKIDSLLSPIGHDLGYSGASILAMAYPTDSAAFHGLARKDFFYTEDRARVTCFIQADSADSGRAVEMTLEKRRDNWFIRRFDLK
ncbi:MAG: hypothetical protein JW763_01790 [candidate division Zixibacteria bacterium]|nr:hypothetical protein [candidate division Zixibacteria bacterium]